MTLIDDIFCLEPLVENDAKSLNKLMIRNGKRFQKFLPKTLADNLTESSSREYIKTKNQELEAGTGYTFAIKDSKKNKVAGLVILKEIDWEKSDGEFAYCIGKKYQGRGWVSQSIKAFSDFAFENLGLSKLHIIIHNSNLPSINVAENAGFRWILTLPNEFVTTGKGSLDMELYEKER